MLAQPNEWAVIAYEGNDQAIHTAENGYCCGDPECVCADVEEADLTRIPNFLPSTEEALRELRGQR